MAATFIGATTASANGGYGITTYPINVPAGVQDGDLLILVNETQSHIPSGTVEGGWSNGRLDQSPTGFWLYTEWRKAASEPASYTMQKNGNDYDCAVLLAYRATGLGDSPVDTSGGQGSATVTSSVPAPAISPAQGSDLITCIYLLGGGGPGTMGFPPDLTERVQGGNLAIVTTLIVADEIAPTSPVPQHVLTTQNQVNYQTQTIAWKVAASNVVMLV